MNNKNSPTPPRSTGEVRESNKKLLHVEHEIEETNVKCDWLVSFAVNNEQIARIKAKREFSKLHWLKRLSVG